MENKLEDFKLEIILLQNKDYKNAKKHGFNNKKDWYDYIINKEQDEIAQAVIDLAERYEVIVENVAKIFDATMIMRVSKILQNKKEIKRKE